MEKTSEPSRDAYIKALSNYSECIRPFLRVAQERYIGGYYAVEGQQFDFNKYCVQELKEVTAAKKTIISL